MVKINFLTQTQQKTQGVIVGSLFPVEKVNGFSIKWKSKYRNEKNELVDITGEKLMDLIAGTSMLAIKNSRQREGKRDPSHIIYCNPDAEPYQAKKD